MAKRKASFVDLHAEKIALAICVLTFIGAGVYSFGGLRFTVRDKNAAELLDEAEELASTTARIIANAQPPKNPTGGDKAAKGDPIQSLQEWFNRDDDGGLIKIAGIEPQPYRTQRFPPLRTEITGVAQEDRRTLVRLTPPSIPVLVEGRAGLEIGERVELAEYLKGGSEGQANRKSLERNYVSVASQIDLIEQETNFNIENYPPQSYLQIAAVHLQRLDLAEPWQGWQDVDTYLPFKRPRRSELVSEGGDVKLGPFNELRQLLDQGRELVARTPLPTRGARTPPVPFLDRPPSYSDGPSEADRRAKGWIELARKAFEGRKPFEQKDLDLGWVLARAAAGTTNASEKTQQDARKLLDDVVARMPKDRKACAQVPLRDPKKMMPLVAHDIDVEPGRTYVYRMRYEVLNIYAGNPGELKDPDDARVLTLLSDWSPPSRPVTLKNDLYFFLTKADPKKQEATVTVYRKTRAGWRDKDYKVSVGESIGEKSTRGIDKGVDFSTGTVCVDLDFNKLDPAPAGKKTVALVYVDPNDGLLKERFLSRDRRDRDVVLKRLLAEDQQPKTAKR